MAQDRIAIKFAGEAGQGVESNGALLARTLVGGGLHIFGCKDYESRIRGGLNFYRIDVDEQPVHAQGTGIHLLLAQTVEAVERFAGEIVAGGGVIYDEKLDVDAEALRARGIVPMPAPLQGIAKEHGKPVMAGAASVAVAAAVFRYPLEPMLDVLGRLFKKKGEEVIEANRAVAQAAYEYGAERCAEGFEFRLSAQADPPERMLLDGNQALAYGALVGGCNFVAGYPMTPGTSVMEWLAGHGASHGVVVKHSEDEISGLNMVVGAAHMGARAMTSTSGGGFALMVEALSLAGITETPVVIVLAQRPGPATGLATRTEQADLKFALSAGHGEFPRILLAPGSIEECFEAGWRAFNLAETYQTPVIILTEHYLATSTRTVDQAAFDLSKVSHDRGKLLDSAGLDDLDVPFERYEISGDGISPRALPGHPNAVFTITGNEHTPRGSLTEDAEMRTAQNFKRLSKLDTAAARDMRPPVWHGPEEADTTLVCWGGTTGPAREAAEQLNAAGAPVNVLQFADLWPLDREAVADELVKAGRLIAVEGNATAQWASVLRGEMGCDFDGTVLKWDGRPLSPDFIAARLTEEA